MTRLQKLLPLFCTSVLLMPTMTHAARPERCMAVARASEPADENPYAVLKKGEVWGPITQARVNKRTGNISYCAHGGHCYPSSHIQFTSPCEIDGTAAKATDNDQWFYDVR